MSDIFENLDAESIAVHEMLKLQDRYPDLEGDKLSSYKNRVKLRLCLLCEFADKNNLGISLDRIKEAITGVDEDLINEMFGELDHESSDSDTKKAGGRVVLFNGGPASGKSSLIQEMDLPEDTVFLDRDSLFAKLPPYTRLQEEAPDNATNCVVTEAIMYNERDAYRYALLSNAKTIIADGTMSYLDLGMEMIRTGQQYGYKVEVINIDVEVNEAIIRAKGRARKYGKTINKKLLYESHVRCALHFFHYVRIADHVQNWNKTGDKGKEFMFASSEKVPKDQAPEESAMVKIYPAGDEVIIYTITDKYAYGALIEKSMLPLDNPSWPPNYDVFLEQRN